MTEQLRHGAVCGSGWAALLLRVWRGAVLESSMLCSMCPHLQTAAVVKKKAFPAVSLSVSDLRSLCSKITAQPSSTALMYMKQNGSTRQIHSTHGRTCAHGCTHIKAGRVIYSIDAANSREIGKELEVYLQFEHLRKSITEVVQKV